MTDTSHCPFRGSRPNSRPPERMPAHRLIPCALLGGVLAQSASGQVMSVRPTAGLGASDFDASTRMQFGASVPPSYQVAVVGNQGLAPGVSAQITSALESVVTAAAGQGGLAVGTSPTVWNSLTGDASFRVEFVAVGPPGEGLLIVTVNGPGFVGPIVLADTVNFAGAQGLNLNFVDGGGAFYGDVQLTAGAIVAQPLGPTGNWSGTEVADSTLSGWDFSQNWALEGTMRFFPGGTGDAEPRLQIDMLTQGLAYQLSDQGGTGRPAVANYGYVQDLVVTEADFQQAQYGGADGIVQADIYSRAPVTFDIAAGSTAELAGGLFDLTAAVPFVEPADFGAASFVKDGEGTLILSGTSDYQGPMRLNAGTVVLQDASGAGGAGLEIGTATLRLETDLAFSASRPVDVLAASDAVIESPALRTIDFRSTVTGDAASSLTLRRLDITFNGDASAFLGDLALDESLFTMSGKAVGGSLLASNGSFVDATGQVGRDLEVAASVLQLTGGDVTVPGTLDVLRSFAIDGDSVLRANVFVPLVGGAGTIRQSDRINVNSPGSTASMDGELVALLNRDVSTGAVVPGRGQERTWRIIDSRASGGGTGEFSSARLIVFDSTAGVISEVDLPINTVLSTDVVQYRTAFDADGATITLFGLGPVPNTDVFVTPCGTYSGTEVNAIINRLLPTEAFGNEDASAVAGAILLYEDPADIPPAYAATQQRNPYADPDVILDANAMAGRVAMLRLMQVRDGALGTAAANAADPQSRTAGTAGTVYPKDFGAPLNGPTPDEDTRVWMRGYGFYENVDGDDCIGCGYDASIGAAMVGIDWATDGGGIIGGFAGIGPGYIGYDAVYGSQHEDVVQAFAGLYGSLVPEDGATYLQGFVLGGYYDFDRTRTIAIPDMVVTRTATSENEAWSISAGGEVGLNLQLSDDFWLQPFAGVTWGQFWGNGYAETGAKSLNLRVQGQSANEWQPTAGGRLLFTSREGQHVLSPFIGCAFLAQIPVGDGWAPVYTSQFNLNQPTQVPGSPEDRYGGAVQAGLEFARIDGATAYIAFDGAWLTGKQRLGGQIGVMVPF